MMTQFYEMDDDAVLPVPPRDNQPLIPAPVGAHKPPSVYHVPDDNGGFVDARKAVAFLMQCQGLDKLSKDRVAKIIQAFSVRGKQAGTAAYVVGDAVQSVGLNSIASFCFEDNTVPGGLRFWLGKILRMVHRPKSGVKKMLTSPIALKDMPADLCLVCAWLAPVHHDNVLTAQQYVYAKAVATDLLEVEGKYIISSVMLDYDEIGGHYRLPDSDYKIISKYITETAASFADPNPNPVRASGNKRKVVATGGGKALPSLPPPVVIAKAPTQYGRLTQQVNYTKAKYG